MSLTKKEKMDDFKPELMPDKEWRRVKNYIRKLSMRALTAEQITAKVEEKFKVSKYDKPQAN